MILRRRGLLNMKLGIYVPFAVIDAIIISALVFALAVVLVRFNVKHMYVTRCAAAATTERLERIYKLVEQLGTVPSNGYVLARTNTNVTDETCLIPIPKDLPEFPWGGRVIEVRASKEVAFHFVETSSNAPALLGKVYRPVLVPRHQSKRSNKEQRVLPSEIRRGQPRVAHRTVRRVR